MVYAASKLAAGVFIENGDCVLLIRRGEEPAKRRWDVPGGFLEEGEKPENGARREVYEELGVELGALDLFVDLNDSGETPVVDILYRCSEVRGTPKPLEVMDLGWFSPDAIPEDLAFDATHRLLAKWRETRIRRGYRLLDGTLLEPEFARLISTEVVLPREGTTLPADVYVECGEWCIHDGALCGRVEGEQPAALWLKESVEGDHLLVFRAYVVPPAKGDINSYWDGSGRVLGEGDVACTIAGVCAFWDTLSGIERHPEGGLRITTRKPPLIPGRVYEIAVGRRGVADFRSWTANSSCKSMTEAHAVDPDLMSLSRHGTVMCIFSRRASTNCLGCHQRIATRDDLTKEKHRTCRTHCMNTPVVRRLPMDSKMELGSSFTNGTVKAIPFTEPLPFACTTARWRRNWFVASMVPKSSIVGVYDIDTLTPSGSIFARGSSDRQTSGRRRSLRRYVHPGTGKGRLAIARIRRRDAYVLQGNWAWARLFSMGSSLPGIITNISAPGRSTAMNSKYGECGS